LTIYLHKVFLKLDGSLKAPARGVGAFLFFEKLS